MLSFVGYCTFKIIASKNYSGTVKGFIKQFLFCSSATVKLFFLRLNRCSCNLKDDTPKNFTRLKFCLEANVGQTRNRHGVVKKPFFCTNMVVLYGKINTRINQKTNDSKKGTMSHLFYVSFLSNRTDRL